MPSLALVDEPVDQALELRPDRPPRFATPRDPTARSHGRQVGIIAAALGTPFMPWQQLVADVALERDPARPDRWRYPVVVVTVPRQAGKTTLVRAVSVQRAIVRRRAKIFATAQRGKDARNRWKDMIERVEHSPLASQVRVLRGTGSESLIFPNGSEIRPFAPVATSLHGETPPLVIIDEAWAFDASTGEDLMAAIRPAQITLPDRQLWIISTAGTADSSFLREWVDVGRAAVEDRGSGIAYFEWSADPDADAYAPETWEFHPALGYTIEAGDLAAEAENTSRGNFERAYLNRWTTTSESVVDLELFDELTNPAQVAPASSELTFAYDVAHDRSGASVYTAWTDSAGVLQLKAYLVKAGAAWLPAAILALVEELHPKTIAADDGGPTRQVTDQLRRAGLEVETLGYRDYGTACGSFMAHIKDRALQHDGTPALREALERAAIKFVSDQVGWDRRRSSGPIDALVASTVAAWASTHAAAPMPKPMIRGAA